MGIRSLPTGYRVLRVQVNPARRRRQHDQFHADDNRAGVEIAMEWVQHSLETGTGIGTVL